MIFKYDLYSLENPYLCIRVEPVEIRFPDKERAVPPREIPIQNRSAFAIYLFCPYHVYNLLFVVAHTISQNRTEVQRVMSFIMQ